MTIEMLGGSTYPIGQSRNESPAPTIIKETAEERKSREQKEKFIKEVSVLRFFTEPHLIRAATLLEEEFPDVFISVTDIDKTPGAPIDIKMQWDIQTIEGNNGKQTSRWKEINCRAIWNHDFRRVTGIRFNLGGENPGVVATTTPAMIKEAFDVSFITPLSKKFKGYSDKSPLSNKNRKIIYSVKN